MSAILSIPYLVTIVRGTLCLDLCLLADLRQFRLFLDMPCDNEKGK